MKIGIGLFYGWIYLIVFIFINIILMKVYPKHYTKRLFTIPPFTNVIEKIFSLIYALIFNLTFIMICFLYINNNIIFVIIGSTIYLFSIICIIFALRIYALTDPNKPVINGIYKISRHPQQVFSCFMVVGIGISLANKVIIFSGIIQLLLLYPSTIAQEKYCLNKYGIEYEQYLNKTPRYFLFF